MQIKKYFVKTKYSTKGQLSFEAIDIQEGIRAFLKFRLKVGVSSFPAAAKEL